jgi:hypothetical protein
MKAKEREDLMTKPKKRTISSIIIKTILSLAILVLGVAIAIALNEKPGLAQSATSVYALTDTGLFVTEAGQQRELETVPELPVAVAVAPTNADLIYIGGATSGIHRSTDGGQTWQPVGEDAWYIPGAALRGTAIAIDEQDVDHVAVATIYGLGKGFANAAVYETTDAGRTWRKLANSDELIETLRIEDGTVVALTENGLERYSPVQTRPFINPTISDSPY